MFNTTYIEGSKNINHVKINAISGTLVKNYRKSFFLKCSMNGSIANFLFDAENPRIKVSYKFKGAIEEEEYRNGHYYSVYFKPVVVLQTMVLADGLLLNEIMWKEDFDEMYKFAEGLPLKEGGETND